MSMTTTGYAALAAGESWHYVGSGGGEPAFENSWGNGSFNQPKMAFRLREAGVVDIVGVVEASADMAADLEIFTLPAAYRPSVQTPGMVVWQNGATRVGPLYIFADGTVVYGRTVTSGDELFISGQFFLIPPDLAP